VVQGMMFNEMRSKTKCMMQPIESLDPKDFPDWSYDGSSTGQAKGNNSDCILK
jgi:glutamine synthetase